MARRARDALRALGDEIGLTRPAATRRRANIGREEVSMARKKRGAAKAPRLRSAKAKRGRKKPVRVVPLRARV